MHKLLLLPLVLITLTACTTTPTPNTPSFSMEQVSQHNTKADCWMVVGTKIYDITSYFGQHPAGDAALERACGKDATANFNKVSPHKDAGELLNGYFKGDLK